MTYPGDLHRLPPLGGKDRVVRAGKTRSRVSAFNQGIEGAHLLKKHFGKVAVEKPLGPDIENTIFEDMAAMLVNDYKVNARKERECDQGQNRTAETRIFSPVMVAGLWAPSVCDS